MSGVRLSEELLSRLTRPASVDDVRGALPVLCGLLANPETAEEATDHLEDAFRVLRRMTADDPDAALELLTDEMVPLCLVPDDQGDELARELRRSLSHWLGTLPDEHRGRGRDAVLSRAIVALEGSAVEHAVSLIESVGYWDDDVRDALKRLAFGRDDDAGGRALAALATLHAIQEDPELPEALARLHHGITLGFAWYRLTAAQLIGTSETADILWSHWFTAEAALDVRQRMSGWFVWSALVWIASRSGSQEEMIRAWERLVELSRRPSEEDWGPFEWNNLAVDLLDVPGAVPELVGLLRGSDGAVRYRRYHRILECKRPAVVAGWDSVRPENLEDVLDEAKRPTGQPGQYSTGEMFAKTSAWEVLLCRGDESLLPSIDEAVDGENAYVSHRFLELAACLGLAVTPTSVAGFIAGTRETEWSDEDRRMAQAGAIEAALGVGNREAFDVLLDYRQIGKQGILRMVIEALAELAARLSKAGNESVYEELFSRAEGAERPETRKIAASTIGYVLRLAEFDRRSLHRASDLLFRDDVEPFTTRTLLYAFTSLDPGDVPSSAVEYARRTLDAPVSNGHLEGEIRTAATSLLALQHEFASDPSFLSDRLGLRSRDDGLVDVADIERTVPHVLGRYFEGDPDRFAPAIAMMVLKASGIQQALILPWLQESPTGLPALIVDALVARMRRAESSWDYDLRLLRLLAVKAPKKLLLELRPDVVRWFSEARADLADILGEMDGLDLALTDARFDLLVDLTGDGLHAVRRAAYRAATKVEPDRFLELALSWAAWDRSGLRGPRDRAAECAGWFPDHAESSPLRRLLHDRDPEVRRACERSLAEREDRLMAEEFESRVLAVDDPRDIVPNWRYGVALAQVGDDSTLKRLEARRHELVPPSVRSWLSRISKAVETRWTKVMRESPEPWHARRGRLERFSGSLHQGSTNTAVSGSLWLMGAEHPMKLSSWGGWGTVEDGFIVTGDARLVLANEPPTDVLVTQVGLESPRRSFKFKFVGNGPYPDRKLGRSSGD